MNSSLQPTASNIVRSCRIVVIIATAAGFILANYFAHSGTQPSPGAAAGVRTAQPGQCDTMAPARVPGLSRGGSTQCTRREAGHACEACPTCERGPECGPVRTRGIGPRSPGGGPDD